jgi:cytochrome c oxidase subunit II
MEKALRGLIARGGRVRARALAIPLLLFLGACSGGAPQSPLDPAGEFARKADSLWDLTFTVAAVIFFLVEGVLVFTIFKFRRRPGREAAQFHGNTKVEVLLTVVPALILAGIAVPTVGTIFDISEHPANALEVKVTGHRFWWEYEYTDENVTTANELHIPTGRPVYITLEGELIDRVTGGPQVIHSYWVPRLGGKQDVVPGRINHMVLEADEPGTYLGQCTEFCGLGHANMRLRAIAQSPEDFEAWLDSQRESSEAPSSGAAAEGAKLFAEGADNMTQVCSSCHAVEDTSLGVEPDTGPNLTHFAQRGTFASGIFERTDANLAAWLADPAEVKPGALMPDVGLTQEQIDALVAYLQTLD